jgi:hypothetical protein
MRDNLKLNQITRELAENLLNDSSVLKTQVVQNEDQIQIIFKLSDDSSLVYRFDTKNSTKTYFIDEPQAP